VNGSFLHSLGAGLKTAFLRWRVRRLSKQDWKMWHKRVFELHPEYRRPAPREAEREHLRIWRPLRRDVSLNTLRACYNMSGIADPEIMPEELYTSEVEASLNRYDFSYFLSNKNFLSRWLPADLSPEVYLHNIDGEFYSGGYELLTPAEVGQVLNQIEYPVVIKPSMGAGGRDVNFPSDRRRLEELMRGRRNFVVQRKLRQHPFFSRFYDRCLNTVRVCLYKSFGDDKIYFLNAAMRMGKGGSLDNLNAGGIVRFIHEDGTLNALALDNWGEKFQRHPDSGVDFTKRERLPKYEELKELSVRLAREVYLCRLVSFDFCMDEAGDWRVVEINLRNQTIQMAQYAGRPFFKPFTGEVIEYCKQHPRWTIMLPP